APKIVTMKNEEETNMRNIVIRMPNWLGDAVMATPVIADVRAKWPHAQICVLCQGSGIGSLVRGNPHLDEILIFPKPGRWAFKERKQLVDRLRQKGFDLGILLPNSFSSALYFWLGRVARRVGFASDGRGALLTQSVPFPPE